jgi:hypothetical protein
MEAISVTQMVTLFGVILSFIVGSAGLWISIRNSRKTIFINSITTSRIKYLQDLRNNISEFCGLFYSYNSLVNDNTSLSKEKYEILKESDKLKYRIILSLNPEDTYWDTKMMRLIDEIRDLIESNPTQRIDDLITITQYLLKLEWERAKRESKKGILSENEKHKLYQKYLKLYEKHIKLHAVSST